MAKEHGTKFGGVLITSHEVMKLHISESGVSDVIPANALNILPLVLFAYFY